MKLSRRCLLRIGWTPALSTAFGQTGTRTTAVAQERQLLTDMIQGYAWTQMLAVTARLGIADKLAHGPKPVSELAAATGSHEDSLYRVLRTLAGRGIFQEEGDRLFRLTPTGSLLRTGVPGSLRVTAQVMGEEWYWKSWGALGHSVQTGGTGFDHVYGMNTWDWFGRNPGPAALFNSFQAEGTAVNTRSVVDAFDFSSYSTIADIGGGEGELLTAILARTTGSRGILFDLPHVVEDARRKLTAVERDRIEFAAGDFFRSVPAGAKLYVMKHVIHDWNDEKAALILGSCRRAADKSSTLLLIDHIVCGPNQHCLAKIGDVVMMARTGGRNRTEAEFRALLTKAGFHPRRVSFTSTGLGLIEATPRD